MSTMAATQVSFPARARPFTAADLDVLPDDGRRYELIDGVLIVSPAPSYPHQRAASNLHVLLRSACTDEFEVLFAPLDINLADDTVLEPDLLVARRADFTHRGLPTAPTLAVEVLSPSTRRIDLTVKLARYQDAGCPSYWVVDPEVPSVQVFTLAGDQYSPGRLVTAAESLSLTDPFPVTLIPADLVRPARGL